MSSDFSAWFESTARCSEHGQEAAATCVRCGAFCCGSCLVADACEACSTVLRREALPAVARGVAWKLAVAPALLAVSSAVYVARGRELPPQWLAWLVPVLCVGLVLRRQSAGAAWVGAITSLLLLAWQALVLFADGAELRLVDVGLLAIAPAFALAGAEKLSRLRA
ncbi:MAG: hypothetical protein ACO1OB_04060 [Archangium sp.]